MMSDSSAAVEAEVVSGIGSIEKVRSDSSMEVEVICGAQVNSVSVLKAVSFEHQHGCFEHIIQCGTTDIGGDGLQDRDCARIACGGDWYEDCTGGRAASSLDSVFEVHFQWTYATTSVTTGDPVT